MNTDLLIERLSAECAPVQCLRCPTRRALTWFALAAPYVAAVVLVAPSRVDLAGMIGDWRFLAEQAAALGIALAAAFAAFAITVPGYDRRILLAPALPLLIWFVALGIGHNGEWHPDGVAGLLLQNDWFCVRWILTVGAVPAFILAFMLRKGAPMAPYATTALGGLAAAALGHFGLRLFHIEEVSAGMLVWHVGTVFAASAIAGWAGRSWMGWSPMIGALRRRIATG